MNRKHVSLCILTILFMFMVSLSLEVKPVKASGTIYIRADGSIDPITANITNFGNTLYVFTDNNYDEMVVERNNIIIDGASYTLQGLGSGRGIYVVGQSNITIINLTIRGFQYGIRIESSSRVNVSGNYLTENSNGVRMDDSLNNTLSENDLISNTYDTIYFEYCNNTVISGNKLENVYDGIESYASNNTVITKNSIVGIQFDGIWFYFSFNCTISENNIKSSLDDAINLEYSFNNRVTENNITANENQGIDINSSSENNVFSENKIADNHEYGVLITNSRNNVFHHNNFLNNTIHADVDNYANEWDDGFEGNYWSNYTGVDVDHDGIGDAAHVLDASNRDNHPLMGLFHSYDMSLSHQVKVVSNSTIEDFKFFESNGTIRMIVSNSSTTQSFGFCRLIIPKDLMPPAYTVVINDGATNALYFNDAIRDNHTHRWIYFEYEHSTHEIVITPEFSWFIIVSLLITINLLTVFIKRKRYLT